MNVGATTVFLPIGEGFRIRQITGMSGKVYFDVKCQCGGYWGADHVLRPNACNQCKKEIPEYVQGFLVLCRNRNEV